MEEAWYFGHEVAGVLLLRITVGVAVPFCWIGRRIVHSQQRCEMSEIRSGGCGEGVGEAVN